MRRHHRLPRVGKFLAAVSVAVAALAASTALATSAFASPAGDLAAATNSARAAAGLAPLQIDGQLSAVAQAWAEHMAATNTLSHNGALRSQVTNWTFLGENVGYSGDIPTVQQAFMNSPEHRANILNAHYTQMGVGSATSISPACNCQLLWVVVDFRRPATTSASVGAAPATSAPAKPVVKPAAPKATAAPATAAARPTISKPTAKPAAQPTTQPAPAGGDAAPAQPASAPTTASTSPSTSAAVTPGTSASAALGTQLAAVAASPSAASTAADPVSRVLTFATVMSQLPS